MPRPIPRLAPVMAMTLSSRVIRQWWSSEGRVERIVAGSEAATGASVVAFGFVAGAEPLVPLVVPLEWTASSGKIADGDILDFFVGLFRSGGQSPIVVVVIELGLFRCSSRYRGFFVYCTDCVCGRKLLRIEQSRSYILHASNLASEPYADRSGERVNLQRPRSRPNRNIVSWQQRPVGVSCSVEAECTPMARNSGQGSSVPWFVSSSRGTRPRLLLHHRIMRGKSSYWIPSMGHPRPLWARSKVGKVLSISSNACASKRVLARIFSYPAVRMNLATRLSSCHSYRLRKTSISRNLRCEWLPLVQATQNEAIALKQQSAAGTVARFGPCSNEWYKALHVLFIIRGSDQLHRKVS